MSMVEARNPFTGETIFSAPSETYESLALQLAAMRSAARAWATLPPAQRADHVEQALQYFRAHRDDIAQAVTREVGKPLAEAAGEVDFMLERAEYMCRFARDGALKPVDLSAYQSDDFQGRIDFVAKGVVYVITPWNYPLFCAINGVVCALLGGSSVLLKHTSAPSVGRHFAQAFGSLAGIGPLLVNTVVDFDQSARIIEEGDIDHVVFTGSVHGGTVIQASLARRAANTRLRRPFIGSSLELGSSDATYIAADADLDHSVEWAVRIGRLHNSGQSCCAVKRVFVHESLHAAFIEKAIQVMQAQCQGDPLRPDTTLGPLYGGHAAVDRLKDMVDAAVAQGASVLAGGSVTTVGQARFIAPTLLGNVPEDAAVLREETFGPVLPVVSVRSDEEAIARINDSDYGLTASIFTRSRSRAERFIRDMESGTVYVNRCNFVDARLGWIGHKGSGNGSISLSPLGLQAICNLRSVNIDPTWLTED
ncbi:aldehyde dehydrogenase family protein [Castellaniella hirudinis]|uniref:aldehyde dehydrogenase family protein n=1 Tax=Castellaniella hirudinis TaxID=1144617 RepID=UPI0039C1D5F2